MTSAQLSLLVDVIFETNIISCEPSGLAFRQRPSLHDILCSLHAFHFLNEKQGAVHAEEGGGEVPTVLLAWSSF